MKSQHAREHRLLEDKLASMRGREWIPDELLDLVAQTSRIQLRACAVMTTASFALPKDRMASEQTHRQGAALLPLEHIPLPGRRGALVFRKILDMLRLRGDSLSVSAEEIHRALSRKAGTESSLRPAQAFTALLRNDAAFFGFWAKRLPDAPALPRFLALSSLAPSFARLHAALADRLHMHEIWPHGHCPLCGSPPLIGRLTGKKGSRYHSCSLCRLEYRAPRLGCPFCGEHGSDRLGVFSADTQPGYAAHVCRTCKSYIKLADFREYTDRTSLPVLDDLESLPLDMLAQQEGFARRSSSAWGF
ncbi:MAG: formate dehydrogenase accessory protein FdhE [Betaproteobacteria bacterium]|nr:formate dehydrogenase accessory protein FdhE [Betaproteobacteria bacterium]